MTTDTDLLLDFRQHLRECVQCELSAGCNGPVPWSGDINPDLCVMAEAPGKQEDAAGLPLIGPTGYHLRNWLKQSGINPDKVTYMNAVNCVSGTTSVRAVGMRSAFSRRYVGEMLTLRTTLDEPLTVTPNHPVLTRGGWIPANELRPGDNLASDIFNSHHVSAGYPHKQRPPSSAKELFRSLSQLLGSKRLAGTNVDFHGDGMECEIDVVPVPRELMDRGETEFYESLSEFFFVGADDRCLMTSTPRSCPQGLVNQFARALTSPYGRVGSRSCVLEVFGAHEPGAQLHRFLVGSNADTSSSEFVTDTFRRNREVLSDSFGSLSPKVPASHFVPLLSVQSRHVDTSVFNFSTDSGWYSSNGIITHNCLPYGTPTATHIRACRGWMNGQLEFIKPKMLLTLGVVAFTALRGDGFPKLSALHGKPMRHPTYDFPIFSTYHPAAHIRGGRTTVGGERKTYEQVILDDIAAMVNWDGFALEECYVCGDELYRYDSDWGIGWCRRHAARQQVLWPEDEDQEEVGR